MSITFWCPDAPTESVRPYPDEPDYVEKRSVLPELNVSNTNAFVLMRAFEIAPDYCGQLDVAALPGLQQRLEALVHAPLSMVPLPTPEPAPQTTTLGQLLAKKLAANTPVRWVPDDSQAYIVSRALVMLDLVRQAIAHSYPIAWG